MTSPKESNGKINWSSGLEGVLVKEGEEAESLFWLHNRASVIATRNNDIINIPCIILQTLTGFFTATSLVPAIALGLVSVLTGIMATIMSYYKFSARAAAHRMSAQLYLKIYKKLEIEMSLPADQRLPPVKLLEEVREKLARISEVAPDIPEQIISQYKKQFKDGDTKKPIIANGLDRIKVFESSDTEPRVSIKIMTPLDASRSVD